MDLFKAARGCAAGKIFQSFSRPGSCGNREPGRIGFMSTQKRVSCRHDAPKRAGGWLFKDPSQVARYVWAFAGDITAPFTSTILLAWSWAATKFLHKDQTYRHFVQPAFAVELPGSPPPLRASGRLLRRHLARQLTGCGVPASPGRPAIPLSSGFAPSPLTLPDVPADFRRAERHDGKRDLYLLHAA
jgi:hypothetical protein